MPRTQAIFSTVFSLPDIDPRPFATPPAHSHSDPREKDANVYSENQYFLPHRWLYRIVYYVLSSLDISSSVAQSVNLHFIPAAPGIDDSNILQARIMKETKALQSFQTQLQSLHWRTLYDVHVWLFSQHMAYASKRLIANKDGENSSGEGKKKPLTKEEELLLQTY